jgi:MFS family permease
MVRVLKEHKGIVLVGLLGVFACLGLARFAFGMILPDMQINLHMNATQAGIVGSANFTGYFLGLFVVGRWYAKFGPRNLIFLSLLAQAVGMLSMALSSNYLIASAFFVFTGFFGALANISIMTFIAQSVPLHMKGRATGIVMMGIGLSVILSGIITPTVSALVENPWRISWAIFALLVFATSVLSFFKISKNPTLFHDQSHNDDALTLAYIFKSCPFWQTGILFFIFGSCAIMFMTFFVAALEEAWLLDAKVSGIFWAILGVSSLFSGPIFGMVSDKFGRHVTLGILFGLQGFAHLLVAFNVPLYGFFISAAIFGLSTWAVPSIMATLSSELFGSKHTARILAIITLFFGVGQMIGPLVAGVLRDLKGDYSLAFTISTFLLWSGVFIAFKGCKNGR